VADSSERVSPSDDRARVVPVKLNDDQHVDARWSVYLVRLHLAEGSTALKVGMVGTGTLGQRLARHRIQFGTPEVIAVWSLADAAERLEEAHAWRMVERYEARLQFAPEFDEPSDPTPAA
jgi:hypothetical protein